MDKAARETPGQLGSTASCIINGISPEVVGVGLRLWRVGVGEGGGPVSQ